MTAPDELRAPLLKALEALRDQLALGERFGDPHLAFTVLLYPDEVPAIVAITEQGICEFERLASKTREQFDGEHEQGGRFFTGEELDEAATALSAAFMAFRTFPYRKDEMKLGAHVIEHVAQVVERHRAYPIERALKEAAYEERMKWKCEGCANRYGTERGLNMHQTRTIATRCKEALTARTARPAS